ncbi:hypothetical protein ILUMI_21618 [Ignelater luminosus]|uniref:protein-tyrosine-phosphatase n=1 Tax=Ignelater luminosus TaxID=2038154 RepID=A0A8K0CHD4_IGNLU|nr:hypothetical protein ILUMI_21618 [Ignelater luminosus]
MLWDYESESKDHLDTPTSTSNKRKCLTYCDSGLGKESLLNFESETSLYEQQALEDHDIDSRDSGCDEEENLLGVVSQKSPWLSNEESMDFSNVDININADLPSDFEALISGSFLDVKDSPTSTYFKQSVALNAIDKPNKVPFSKIESDGEFRSSKRSKASKYMDASDPAFKRSLSINEEEIKYALQRSSTEPNLIGDFSKACCLPLTSGRHQDLKCITAATLASLVKGEYDHELTSYKIIDCRFPYEFDGGHIKGAINLYTKEHIVDMLNECEHLGHALVFHCEFSSERGPGLYRFLRKLDRNRNEYPKLNYPELYLLDGGYKNFFQQHADLCVPHSYKPMLDPQHQADLRFFKAQSKSFNEDRLRPNNKGNFKRLGFS